MQIQKILLDATTKMSFGAKNQLCFQWAVSSVSSMIENPCWPPLQSHGRLLQHPFFEQWFLPFRRKLFCFFVEIWKQKQIWNPCEISRSNVVSQKTWWLNFCPKKGKCCFSVFLTSSFWGFSHFSVSKTWFFWFEIILDSKDISKELLAYCQIHVQCMQKKFTQFS